MPLRLPRRRSGVSRRADTRLTPFLNPAAEIGLIAGARGFKAIADLPAGYLSDRFGRKKIALSHLALHEGAAGCRMQLRRAPRRPFSGSPWNSRVGRRRRDKEAQAARSMDSPRIPVIPSPIRIRPPRCLRSGPLNPAQEDFGFDPSGPGEESDPKSQSPQPEMKG